MTTVYVIQAEGGPVKVGVAINPQKRLAALRTGTPFRLSLAHVEAIEDDLRAVGVERAAHALLSTARAHGEWFNVTAAEATAAVQQAVGSLRQSPVLRPTHRATATATAPSSLMLTAAHIRAARALLDITQAELAERVRMSKTGLNNIERGNADPKASTLGAIERYLVEAGIEFSNGGEPGVRLRRAPST